MKVYVIYTDGSCDPNPGVGGFGAVIEDEAGAVLEVSGRLHDTTNNRMELLAALKALEACDAGSKVHVITDSRYLEQGATVWYRAWVAKGWRKVVNPDMWQALLAEHGRHHDVTYEWVKGHEGHPGNEQAHQLAEQARLYTRSSA